MGPFQSFSACQNGSDCPDTDNNVNVALHLTDLRVVEVIERKIFYFEKPKTENGRKSKISTTRLLIR